jgi:hypothetical protein
MFICIPIFVLLISSIFLFPLIEGNCNLDTNGEDFFKFFEVIAKVSL